MPQGARIYEVNRRLAEIGTYLILLDELEEKGFFASEEDVEKTSVEWTPEMKEIYNLRSELEAEREELEKELALILEQHPPSSES